jgi:hypothetical protein
VKGSASVSEALKRESKWLINGGRGGSQCVSCANLGDGWRSGVGSPSNTSRNGPKGAGSLSSCGKGADCGSGKF